ncbi:MAG TPA: hypothetical protein VHC49_09840 [Mycobacteriales bacterium]|nr:hypothetical protein [Mycobacteriales bacterium]
MDGHDWTHEHLEHPDHDLDLPDADLHELPQEHGYLDDLIAEDHHHEPLAPPAPADGDHNLDADAGLLPAEEIALEPAAASIEPLPFEVPFGPVDGQDWVDPGLLGGDAGPEPVADYAPPEELLSSLHAAGGAEGAADWDVLGASDDPAVRALAEFWRPE